jgi:hypothetical protein
LQSRDGKISFLLVKFIYLLCLVFLCNFAALNNKEL